MAELLVPLRDRRVLIVAVVVALLVLGALVFLAPPRVHEGARLVSAVFLSCALGCMAAAAVLFVRIAGEPRPDSVLAGLDPARRRDISRAVIRGDEVNLSEPDESHAIGFAQAYRSWLPAWTAPFLALMLGVLLEALGQLRTWDGGFVSIALVLEFVLVAAIFALVPLQLRRVARAKRFLSRRAHEAPSA